MLTLEQARNWYPAYDPVHGFDHIERVYSMCQLIGAKENANMQILLTATLLHDASGSQPEKGKRENHHIDSADFAGQLLTNDGWSTENINAVKHCILAHRFRKDTRPKTIEAKVLFDADKLDVIGAIGVVRALAYAQQVRQPAYAKPSDQFLRNGKRISGEAHSAFHEYIFKLKHISSKLFTATAIEIAKQRQDLLDAFFEKLAEESDPKTIERKSNKSWKFH